MQIGKGTIYLKRFGCLLLLLLLLCPMAALTDDAGVLTERELNEWVVAALRQSVGAEPVNAPVGEEARTEDGYAFIYDFATLYYDKPELDERSVLMAVSVTNESYAGPRGIRLGGPADALIETYGWQNPTLVGDGVFAALYRLNSLPQAAYWSWAQHDESGVVTGMQCAIHVRVADGRYTDAGVTYSLEDGAVTAIHVYGLNSFVTEAEVRANLEAVSSVNSAAFGDASAPDMRAVAVSVPASAAAPFALADLAFAGLNYAGLTPEGARAALGTPAAESAANDETGGAYLHMSWDGAEMIWMEAADGASGRMESLRVTGGAIIGPRGVATGMRFDEATALFASSGATGLLYGGEEGGAYAEAVREGGQTIVTYHTSQADGGYALQLVFENDALSEWIVSASDL